jgi:hypothetical protein
MSDEPQERGGAADRAAILAAGVVALAFIGWIAAVQSGQGHARRDRDAFRGGEARLLSQ